MFGEDHELADDLRKLASSRTVEGKCDFAVARLFQPYDVAVVRCELRAVLPEGAKGKNCVLRRDRLAVVPLRFGTQPIGGRRKIIWGPESLGNQAVFARKL